MQHNIALIGYGKWGEIVADRLEANQNFKLKAIVSSNTQIKKININLYKNLEELLNNEKIDCLYIAKDPDTNFKILKFLKTQKIPMILEKPFGKNINICRQMINIINNNKTNVFTNLPNIYSDTYDITQNFILSNFHQIKKIILHEGGAGPTRTYVHPILDWGIHSIGYIISLFAENEIKNIKYKEIINFQKNKFVLSRFDIKLQNNLLIKILTGNSFKKKTRVLKIVLKNGDIFINDLIKHQIWQNNQLNFTSNKSPLDNLLNKFSDSIKNNDNKVGMEEIYTSFKSIKIIKRYI